MEMMINIAAIAMLSFGIWLLYTISGVSENSTDDRVAKDEN